MQRLIMISVFFMAFSLASFMVRNDPASVAIFGCASAVFAFLCYLERKELRESEVIKERIKVLEGKINDIHVHMGFRG